MNDELDRVYELSANFIRYGHLNQFNWHLRIMPVEGVETAILIAWLTTSTWVTLPSRPEFCRRVVVELQKRYSEKTVERLLVGLDTD